MFGFNINMGDTDSVIFEIYQGNALVQRQQITMPLSMLQAQFMQMVEQAAAQHGKNPIRIKMWKPIEIEGNKIEANIEFRNWFEEGEE